MRDQITNLKTPIIKQQTITQLSHTTTTISIHTKKVYMIWRHSRLINPDFSFTTKSSSDP
ncbi:hypothetical protein Hanom_Chr02g00113291 [Helianthus anomalus]